MKSANDCLLQYLMQYNYSVDDSSKILTEKICNLGLDLILLSELKSLDKAKYLKAVSMMLYQKFLNEVFKKEISVMLEYANKKQFKLIPLKGLFLAADIYDDINIRKSGDIDLLISYSDIKLALEMLSEMGYLTKKDGKKPALENLKTKAFNPKKIMVAKDVKTFF